MLNIVDFISSNQAVSSLVVFASLVVLFVWDKLPMATSAILGCAIMVLLGISDFSTTFGSFASSTVLMLIGVLIVGMAIDETGIAGKIGDLIIKSTKGSERKFIAVSFTVAFLLSSFMTNVTVLAIFLPIVFSLGKANKNINPMNIIMPITLASTTGGVTTLVGSSQQMTAQGLLEEYGYETFEVFDLTPLGLIIGVIALLYCLFIGYPLGKKIWGDRESTSEINIDDSATNKELDKRKCISIGVIFVLMVFFYIYKKIPFTDIVMEPHITAIMSALLCIITGCISQKKAVMNVNWNIVGRLAACLGIAKVLQASGGIDLVANWFMNVVGGDMSPFAIFAILVLFAQIFSLFISNSTAISVTLLIVMAIAEAMTLNVPAFALGIIFGASMGASCPLSSSTWGISMSAGYKFKDYFKYGAIIDALGYIATIIFIPLTMGLTV